MHPPHVLLVANCHGLLVIHYLILVNIVTLWGALQYCTLMKLDISYSLVPCIINTHIVIIKYIGQ
jgi:hypothetical protein